MRRFILLGALIGLIESTLLVAGINWWLKRADQE